MAEANRAYEAGDLESLRHILDEYHNSADPPEGEGLGAELIRIIRQISQAKDRMSAIGRELAILRQSEIARLARQAKEREHDGCDLLAELAAAIRQQIALARNEHEDLAHREAEPA